MLSGLPRSLISNSVEPRFDIKRKKSMLRFIPGVCGAACSYIALKLLAPMPDIALWLEILIYAVVFVAVAYTVDRAMSSYGR